MEGVRVPLSNSLSSSFLGMWGMGGAFSEWGSSLKESYSRNTVIPFCLHLYILTVFTRQHVLGHLQIKLMQSVKTQHLISMQSTC